MTPSHHGPCPECGHEFGEYVNKKRTVKQLIKDLRSNDVAASPSTIRMIEEAADTIERQRNQIANLKLNHFVPMSVRFRRGEADGATVLSLDFDALVVDTMDERSFRLTFSPNSFASMMIAALAGLGFSESDLEYVAERYERTFQ